MPTFHIPEALADARFTAGGREYTFSGTELTVEEEADAKRIRTFAYDYPQIGISESGEPLSKPAETSGEIVPDEPAAEDTAPAAEAAEAETTPDPEPVAPEAPSAEDETPRKRGRRAE